jgi:hypothetical protein
MEYFMIILYVMAFGLLFFIFQYALRFVKIALVIQ